MSKGTIILIVVILFVIGIVFLISIKGYGLYGYRGYNRAGWFHIGPSVYYGSTSTGSVRAGSISGRTYRGGGIGRGK